MKLFMDRLPDSPDSSFILYILHSTLFIHTYTSGMYVSVRVHIYIIKVLVGRYTDSLVSYYGLVLLFSVRLCVKFESIYNFTEQ